MIAPMASSRLPFGFLLVISPRAIVVTPSNLMEWTIGSAKFLAKGRSREIGGVIRASA